MKQKYILFGSITLLLVVVLFMAWDIFLNKAEDSVNPYAYDLQAFRKGDTAKVMYRESGTFDPGLTGLHGIHVDRSGRILVSGEGVVGIFDVHGKSLMKFNTGGSALAVHADSSGSIWLAMEDHIEQYTAEGKRLHQWESCGEDAVITSITSSGADLFVADAGNRVVYRYDLSGRRIQKLGEKDPSRGIPGFVVPSPYFDLASDGKGGCWVVNPGRHLVEHYTRDGERIASWGVASMTMEGFCGCCNPSNIAILSDGSFVTSEKTIERIKVYWPDGTFRCIVAGPGSFTEGTRGLDLAVDSQDHIYVLDPEQNRVRIFEPVNKPADH